MRFVSVGKIALMYFFVFFSFFLLFRFLDFFLFECVCVCVFFFVFFFFLLSLCTFMFSCFFSFRSCFGTTPPPPPPPHFFLSGPEVMKLISCSAQLSMNFQMLISIKNIKTFSIFQDHISLEYLFPAHKCYNASKLLAF